MKRVFMSLFIALMAITTVQAQQIAVVAENGTTTLYRTLQEAIEGAPGGSVIYLPGGGFQISDDVKITKKLTIIGIGHKVKGENADGNTTITGNLFFNKGSDGSAVMGCYLSGNVNIGEDNAVHEITIRKCNLSSVQVKKSDCTGTVINQNYIRGVSNFNGAGADFTNNVADKVDGMKSGNIAYNVFTRIAIWPDYIYTLTNCKSCTVINNVFYGIKDCSDSQFEGNMYSYDYSNYIQKANNYYTSISNDGGGIGFLFLKYEGISPNSNFHFSEDYSQYEGQVGIYAGPEPFDDKQMAPVPYIIEKKVDPQTDASGQLNIKIRVKASE